MAREVEDYNHKDTGKEQRQLNVQLGQCCFKSKWITTHREQLARAIIRNWASMDSRLNDKTSGTGSQPGGREKSVHVLLQQGNDAFFLCQIQDQFHHYSLLPYHQWK